MASRVAAYAVSREAYPQSPPPLSHSLSPHWSLVIYLMKGSSYYPPIDKLSCSAIKNMDPSSGGRLKLNLRRDEMEKICSSYDKSVKTLHNRNVGEFQIYVPFPCWPLRTPMSCHSYYQAIQCAASTNDPPHQRQKIWHQFINIRDNKNHKTNNDTESRREKYKIKQGITHVIKSGGEGSREGGQWRGLQKTETPEIRASKEGDKPQDEDFLQWARNCLPDLRRRPQDASDLVQPPGGEPSRRSKHGDGEGKELVGRKRNNAGGLKKSRHFLINPKKTCIKYKTKIFYLYVKIHNT